MKLEEIQNIIVIIIFSLIFLAACTMCLSSFPRDARVSNGESNTPTTTIHENVENANITTIV